MSQSPPKPPGLHTSIVHITHLDNLAKILGAGGLRSDAEMAKQDGHQVIGYSNIKDRRLKELRVAACGNRLVGEFVPFYFCVHSPMLLAINSGKTGLPPGSQKDILHLISTVGVATELNRDWVFSDGNAGAVLQPNFFRRVEDLAKLDWEAIRTRYWSACRDAKQAEFLVADFFPWTGITKIGCHSATTATHVQEILKGASHRPEVLVKPEWYY